MAEKKRIIHFSTSDNLGAGFAAYRFHRNLIKNGMNSILFVLEKTSNDPTVIKLNLKLSMMDKLKNRLEKKIELFRKDYYFFDKGRYALKSYKDIEPVLKNLNLKPDIVLFHWISRFVDPIVLKDLKRQYNPKFFWYLMDMAPITGGCHYAWDCEGFAKGCHDCPALSFKLLHKNLPKRNIKMKKDIVDEVSLSTLSASSHLYSQVERSIIFSKQNNLKLMLGLDSSIFKPGKKRELRKTLGIDDKAKVIYFASSFNNERRKGGQYLAEALNLFLTNSKITKNVVFLTAGHQGKDLEFLNHNGLKHVHLGYLKGDISLANAYKVSDMFLVPSIEDSGPMMINEAILCGTPVVAFKMGVAEDLVISGKTGYLAKLKDSVDFARGIEYISSLPKEEYSKISKNCRQIGIELTSQKSQIKNFINIINSN